MAIVVYAGSIALAYLCLKLYDEPVRKWLGKKVLEKKINFLRVNSKSFPNNISQILPKFTNINVSLGKFVYRHNNSSEVYSYFLNLRCFRS